MVNYLKQILALDDFKLYRTKLSAGQNALWHALMSVNNKTGWLPWFTATNKTLETLSGLSRQGIVDSRNSLKQLGLIDFKSNGRKATSYHVAVLYTSDNVQGTLQDPVQDTLQQSLQDPVQNTSALYKQNKTKKESKPELALEDVLLDFIDFWNVYPKKIKKADAQESYYQARLKGVSAEVILKGAKDYARYLTAMAKSGERPPFKANADNWLDQERWTDEYETPEPREAMSPEQQRDAQKADSDRELAQRLAALAEAGDQP